jgi:hypothetical protein
MDLKTLFDKIPRGRELRINHLHEDIHLEMRSKNAKVHRLLSNHDIQQHHDLDAVFDMFVDDMNEQLDVAACG